LLLLLLLLSLLIQRQGMLDADSGCQRQATAAMLCLQTAVSDVWGRAGGGALGRGRGLVRGAKGE